MARRERSGVVRPSLFWFLLLDGGIIALTTLALSKTAYDKVDDMTGDALPPRETLQAMLIGTAVIHVTEAIVAGRMAKRRGLSPGGWRLQTLVVGFPSLRALRRTVQPRLITRPAATTPATATPSCSSNRTVVRGVSPVSDRTTRGERSDGRARA